jgi:hypothetical protein
MTEDHFVLRTSAEGEDGQAIYAVVFWQRGCPYAGHFATVSGGNRVAVYGARSTRPVYVYIDEDPEAAFYTAASCVGDSGDALLVVAGAPGLLKVIDVVAGRRALLRTLLGPAPVNDLRVLDAGYSELLLSAGSDAATTVALSHTAPRCTRRIARPIRLRLSCWPRASARRRSCCPCWARLRSQQQLRVTLRTSLACPRGLRQQRWLRGPGRHVATPRRPLAGRCVECALHIYVCGLRLMC